ncbi:DUF3017 domain-containing protein [Streptacidiphilus melanogenes]|uniref:DUF3017 domain-containing protein n=1 Tax=Streptacidiphilus melanogenes TaxID=411235 RepID=UPI0005AA1D7F|nr:DUF3017 domain-containing protein [Streptacidiphilus melanogenes]
MARKPKAQQRPPVKTTGTFRPEGGSAAAGRDRPVPVRQWPIVVVLTVVGVGLLVTALGAWRAGIVTVGVGLLVGAVLRAALPEVGMLAVRSRFTDIVVMGVLGLVIVVLALASLPDPVIHLPFVGRLGSMVHSDGGGD